jgi:hypothetical protein
MVAGPCADGSELNINLQKMKKGLMWPSVFVGHAEVRRDAIRSEQRA